MSALVLRADANHLPLPDRSVNLIVSSPPYWSLRSYREGGEHLDGQIGAEPSPTLFLEALWSVMKECWRVLADDGSCFVNLGDKRAGSGAPGTTSGLQAPSSKSTLRGNGHVGGGPKAHRVPVPVQGERSGKRSYAHDRSSEFGRPKSKMMLPARFAIGCMDGLADPDGIGWIVRQDMTWDKPNGMPEPTKDRTRDNHESWFHLTKSGRYYAELDEIREPLADPRPNGATFGGTKSIDADAMLGSSGRRTGSNTYDDVNPLGRVPGSVWRIATEPLVVPEWLDLDHFAAFPSEWPRRLILGWSAPGHVVLDPFGGSGTTAMAARALGRFGISVDLGADYGRLARWRIFDSDGAAKVADRTAHDRQGKLL